VEVKDFKAGDIIQFMAQYVCSRGEDCYNYYPKCGKGCPSFKDNCDSLYIEPRGKAVVLDSTSLDVSSFAEQLDDIHKITLCLYEGNVVSLRRSPKWDKKIIVLGEDS
jgi:hypothetical protein